MVNYDFSDVDAIDNEIYAAKKADKPVDPTALKTTASTKEISTPSYDFSDVDKIPHTMSRQEQQDTAIKSLKEDSSDLLHGITHGAMLGGQDEAGGGLQAILDMGQKGLNKLGLAGPSPTQVNADLKSKGFTGDIGPTSEAELYRQGQQETKKEFDAADKRSPYLYTAGQLGGGIATGSTIAGGLGLGAEALATGKVGQFAARFSPEVVKNASAYLAAAKKAKDMASLKQKLILAGTSMAKMAAMGIPEGAVMGALNSEHNIIGENRDKESDAFLGDVVSGAETGSVVGAGASLAANLVPMAAKYAKNKVGNWIGDVIDDSDTLRQGGLAYQKGKEGINYNSRSQRTLGEPGKFGPLDSMESDASESMINKMIVHDDKLGAQVGKSLEDATKDGIAIDISEELGELSKNLQQFKDTNPSLFADPKRAKLIEKLRAGKGVMTPIEAKGAINEIENLKGVIGRDTNSNIAQVTQTANTIQKMLNDQLKAQVPQFKNAAQRFEEFRRLVPETILRGKTSEAFYDPAYKPLRDQAAKVQGKLIDTFKTATAPGAGEGGVILGNISKSTDDLAAAEAKRISQGMIQPGEDAFSSMGYKKPSDFADEIMRHADETVTKNTAQMSHLGETYGDILSKATLGLAPVGKSGITTGMNTVGRAVGGAKNFSKKLYSLGPEQLNGLAQDLINAKASTQVGKALQRAVAESDTAQINKILFTVMQNPNLRIHISHVLDQDSSDNQSGQ